MRNRVFYFCDNFELRRYESGFKLRVIYNKKNVKCKIKQICAYFIF